MSGPPSIQAPPERRGPARSADRRAARRCTPTPPPAAGRRHAPNKWLAMVTAGFLTLLVMGVLFPNLWYGMHDITDLPVYWGYASRIAHGEAPVHARRSRSSTRRSPSPCSASPATPAARASTASGSTS